MAENSFDIVSKVDLQEVSNAIQQALKEIHTRYDLKDSKSDIQMDEKEALVLKLRKARDRVRRQKGRCEGNPNWIKGANKTIPTDHVKAASAAQARGLSLRDISAELANDGFLNRSGKPYAAQSVKRMLAS